MVCHWPGVYFNGEHVGFNILKTVKKRLDQKYGNLVWMKLNEIARYWAAKELTTFTSDRDKIKFYAPFACPGFTLGLNRSMKTPRIKPAGEEPKPLVKVKNRNEIKSDTWFSDKTGTIVCFDLKKGPGELLL
jgi:hypothetical protein